MIKADVARRTVDGRLRHGALSDCISLGVSSGGPRRARLIAPPPAGRPLRSIIPHHWPPLLLRLRSAHQPQPMSPPGAWWPGPPLPWLSPWSQTIVCASASVTDIFSIISPRPHPRHYTAHFKTSIIITREKCPVSSGKSLVFKLARSCLGVIFGGTRIPADPTICCANSH